MTRFFFILFMLAAQLALAQRDTCQSGRNCTVAAIKATTSATAAGGGSYSVQLPHTAGRLSFCDSAQNCNWWYATNSASNGLIMTNGGGGASFSAAGPGWFANGSAANPSISFSGDTNTGWFSQAADTIGLSLAGTEHFRFRNGGYISNPSLNATLTLNDGTGAGLGYASNGLTISSSLATLTAPTVLLNGSTNGIQISAPGATTAFQANPRVVQVDSNSGRLFWNEVAPSATRPPVDLGGGPHPVMEQRIYALDMGYESTASPTFYPVAPRLGASSATVTVTDAAAASSATLGASPSQVDARGFVTTAAAGSRSLFVTTAFIRKAGHAPRWCQKVSLSTSSNIRVWLGMANADPGANDNPANGAVSFRYSTTAADAAWQACYANGVGTTCASTGVAPSTGTGAYDTLCIDCREGMTTACTWWVNGVARQRTTSGLPAGAPFFPYFSVEARSAAAVTGYSGPMSVEVN